MYYSVFLFVLFTVLYIMDDLYLVYIYIHTPLLHYPKTSLTSVFLLTAQELAIITFFTSPNSIKYKGAHRKETHPSPSHSSERPQQP